jgi:pimeloyl-ACP methyl ester carboxylesterase
LQVVPRFGSYDGTEISYRVLGDGAPVVCVPGGPGRAAEYLGDLGGLVGSRRLVLLDPRGVGGSADPADAATLRVDRLVDDVESLRVHLGLERMDLLAHSAGAVLAMLYTAAYPQRVRRLILLTPGLAAVGVHPSPEQLAAGLERSSAEPWYSQARAAWEKILGGELTLEAYRASRPLFYGRWDDAARAHASVGIGERNGAARQGYFADVVFDVSAIRASLVEFTGRVLLYGGELDPLVTPAMLEEAALLFGDVSVAVQPGAGHFPWVDDPAVFAAAIGSFLG